MLGDYSNATNTLFGDTWTWNGRTKFWAQQNPQAVPHHAARRFAILANKLSAEAPHTEAEQLARQGLTLALRVLGPEHPHTASSKADLTAIELRRANETKRARAVAGCD
jgi:hypothetical protein